MINETRAMGFTVLRLLGNLMHNHFASRDGVAETNKCGGDMALNVEH